MNCWASNSLGDLLVRKTSARCHRSGLEINLIVNAPSAVGPNILMDVPDKHADITHIALQIEAIVEVETALKSAGVAITGNAASTHYSCVTPTATSSNSLRTEKGRF
jgi:hypothetical protein